MLTASYYIKLGVLPSEEKSSLTTSFSFGKSSWIVTILSFCCHDTLNSENQILSIFTYQVLNSIVSVAQPNVCTTHMYFIIWIMLSREYRNFDYRWIFARKKNGHQSSISEHWRFSSLKPSLNVYFKAYFGSLLKVMWLVLEVPE